MTSKIEKLLTQQRKEIREAVANYMFSEGCSCCEGSDHDEHKTILGKLLRVPMYKDKSGYDFSKFRSKSKKIQS